MCALCGRGINFTPGDISAIDEGGRRFGVCWVAVLLFRRPIWAGK